MEGLLFLLGCIRCGLWDGGILVDYSVEKSNYSALYCNHMIGPLESMTCRPYLLYIPIILLCPQYSGYGTLPCHRVVSREYVLEVHAGGTLEDGSSPPGEPSFVLSVPPGVRISFRSFVPS